MNPLKSVPKPEDEPVDLYPVPQSSEAQLRELFSDEDRLLAELAKVRARQKMVRNDYAAAHGLLLRPSLDSLRKVLCNG